MTMDSLRLSMTLERTLDLSALAGKPVAFRFTLRRASLFSFAFRAGAS